MLTKGLVSEELSTSSWTNTYFFHSELLLLHAFFPPLPRFVLLEQAFFWKCVVFFYLHVQFFFLHHLRSALILLLAWWLNGRTLPTNAMVLFLFILKNKLLEPFISAGKEKKQLTAVWFLCTQGEGTPFKDIPNGEQLNYFYTFFLLMQTCRGTFELWVLLWRHLMCKDSSALLLECAKVRI